jgi:hypothetical protein
MVYNMAGLKVDDTLLNSDFKKNNYKIHPV